MSYQLRPATFDDKYFMMELQWELLSRYFSNSESWNTTEQKIYFEHYFRPKHVFIILHNERAIGAVSVLHQKKLITIFYIYLLPEFQKKGIGTAIMQGIMNRAKNERKSVFMSTFKKSTAGKKICDQFGFKEIDGNDIRKYVRWDPPTN